ncbi:YvrJ family protein [Clostridium sp. JS66]|uniref:YvrJ family protein n=1 Tax=Clostridium sp. JS66 TaxID=3064705 RepID=UPI00298DEB7C|nr:YvrJ family protein [Clostridium sp. JS66]WPC43355.1 YvrJ family protein [Clostridium sp. JS66]
MDMNLVNLIGDLGFPIAVSAYLLVRIESKMENLTCSINNLSNAINQMIRDEKKSNDS